MVRCGAPIASAVLAVGCNNHPLVEYGPLEGSSEKTSSWCSVPRVAVDILLVVDDSPSMADEAAMLQLQLDYLLSVYDREESNLDYRMAITTTDMGNPRCDPATRDEGAFVDTSCRERLGDFTVGPSIEGQAVDLRSAGCLQGCALEEIELLPTTIEHGGERRPRPWIERVENITNVPAHLDPTDVLRCLAPAGVSGCAFESPLEAARQAILRSFDPADPAYGFVRPHAGLFVLFITDEPDCSFRPEHAEIFDPAGNRVFWSDPEGDEPTSAVCFNAGVECLGGPDVYDDCRAAHWGIDGKPTDADFAVLTPVESYGWFLREIERKKQELALDPSQSRVFVRVLGGVPPQGLYPGETPGYADASDPAIQTAFGIGPGCEADDGRQAYPPFRLDALANAFGLQNSASLYSTCASDWSVAAACLPGPFGSGGGDVIRPLCFEGCVADTSPETPDVLDPQCQVVQTITEPSGSVRREPLPMCNDASADQTCWQPLTTAEGMAQPCRENGYNLEIGIHRTSPQEGSCVEATCVTSQQRAVDCPSMPL